MGRRSARVHRRAVPRLPAQHLFGFIREFQRRDRRFGAIDDD
jgi:hypothetical protein